jgi:hypothetical protein
MAVVFPCKPGAHRSERLAHCAIQPRTRSPKFQVLCAASIAPYVLREFDVDMKIVGQFYFCYYPKLKVSIRKGWCSDMRNIRSIVLEKYKDSAQFEKMNEHIYKQRSNGSYRITLSCDLEEGEDTQYPLEDLLDKCYVNCVDYFEEKQTNDLKTLCFELEGSLNREDEDYANILEVSKIIGKRIYNKENDGFISLAIE